MEPQIFYLYNKTDYIKVITDSNWSNALVYKNDEMLGEIIGGENLEIGKAFQTSDKKIIFIRLKKPFFRKPRLEVLINGDPYNKKETNSKIDRLRGIYIDILFISAISIIAGLISLILDNSEIRKLDFGYQSLICGFAYFCLGYLFNRKNSWTLLGAIIIILVTDIVILLRFNFDLNHIYNIRYGLLARAYFLYLALNAIIGFYKVKKLRKTNAS